MAEKQWYEEWFDSPYYHILYANRSDNEAESFITKVTAHLQIPQNAKVLDVACGKGRHSKTLAKLGFNVIGIDLSKNSIAEAKQHNCDRLHFEVWDMRQVYKPNFFNYVFNLFSSFGYFDDEADDCRAVQAMYDNLVEGGTLLLDYVNTEWAIKNMKAREIIPRGEIQFHIQKRVEEGFIKKKIEFLVNGEDYSFEEQLKVINQYKFGQMLTSAGFTLLNTYGDYDLNTFNAATSPRLILIAKK
jgi:SAM-dependent methyltransferase